MISERKIAANRVNGRKSRGPRTAAGKSRASRNALRHGLATITRYSPTHYPQIECIATAICGADKSPLLVECALVIAENEIVLNYVHAQRAAIIERLRDVTAQPLVKGDNSLALAKAKLREYQLAYERLEANSTNLGRNDESQHNPTQSNGSKEIENWESKQREDRDEFDAIRLAAPDLNRLLRYERRAWSRQKRAIRDLLAIRARTPESSIQASPWYNESKRNEKCTT